MPNCCDAKLLQGLVRQARKNRLVYLVLAESRLITFEEGTAMAETRKLAAILAADVVGYSRLASADEERTYSSRMACARSSRACAQSAE
jgi:class 3 adenylate cyclase